jgi:cytochrome P450
MQRLTMNAMGSVLLSTNISAEEAAAIGAALGDSAQVVRERNTSWLVLPLWIPTPQRRRLFRAVAYLSDFAERHVRRHESAAPGELPDILTALMQAVDPDTGLHLTHDELVDETKTLFLAGYDTTAISLTWCLYLLARHPQVAQAWYDELDRVLGGRPPEWDDLPRLEYTAQIVHETLRLYPAVYNIARVCVEDDEIDGYPIRKGDIAVVSILGVHRGEAWTPEPEVFSPQRFSSSANWPKTAFLPFASGKHVCLGNQFAVIEMLTALAAIGQRYRLEPHDSEPVEAAARITLVPDRPILLRLIPR